MTIKQSFTVLLFVHAHILLARILPMVGHFVPPFEYWKFLLSLIIIASCVNYCVIRGYFILSFEINVDKRILPMHCFLMFFFLSIKIVGYCVLEVSVLVLQSG